MRPRLIGALDLDLGAAPAIDQQVSSAVTKGRQMVADGADGVEIDALAGRPPLEAVTAVVSALATLTEVSVRTDSADLARAAAAAGATVISDVGADLASLAAELGMAWIAIPGRVVDDRPVSAEVIEAELSERAERARRAGVSDLWVEPGLDHGADVAVELDVLARIGRLVERGWPVAVSVVEPSLVAESTARSDRATGHGDVGPVGTVGSVGAVTWALMEGASRVRVAEVAAVAQAVTVFAGNDVAGRN